MKPKWKYIMILFFFVNHHLSLLCQGEIEIHKILNSVFVSPHVKFQEEKSKQLRNLDFGIPLIEKIELRSETNDFDLRKQDLTVRISPNTFANRKAYKSYHESVQHITELEYETELMRGLHSRYEWITDYVYTSELVSLEKEKYKIVEDKVKLLKRMISLASFDLVELIEAEDELNKKQRLIQSLESELVNLNMLLCILIDTDSVKLQKEDILNIDDIEKVMVQINTNFKSHPEVEILSAQHYNNMMEHEWEAAKTKFSLGFLQMKYGYDPDDNFGNNFSVGVGFDFPIKGSARLNLNEKKLDILDSQSQYIARKAELAHTRYESTSNLKRLIDMYRLLSVQIKDGNADHALKAYSKQGTASPLALIKLKELTISNEALLIELEADITATYLQFLYSSGTISTMPYKNYLDPDLSEF